MNKKISQVLFAALVATQFVGFAAHADVPTVGPSMPSGCNAIATGTESGRTSGTRAVSAPSTSSSSGARATASGNGGGTPAPSH